MHFAEGGLQAKKITALLIVWAMAVCLSSIDSKISYAQGNTKIVVTIQDNKKEVQAGDTFTMYIKAQEIVALFGLQLTLDYGS